MATPTNTLLIEGPFDELADELAAFIDGLSENGDKIRPGVAKLLEDGNKEEALKKLVSSANIINGAPEKAIIPAYNLLLHIVRQLPEPEMFFAKICEHLSQPMPNQQHGPGLSLALLGTMFNIIPEGHESRFHVLMATIKVVKSVGSFDSLQPQLEKLDSWLSAWDLDDEDQRKIYIAISDVASESGEAEEAYKYKIKALRTVPSEDVGSKEAQSLALSTLKAALQSPTHFDFQDITGLDAIQALRNSDAVYFELLEIFTSEQLDDFNDFKDEHEGWIESQGIDKAALDRKMRLLTLSSLAASASQSRELPYAQIAKSLQIHENDVELWVIDVIRAGLVEGKLSQLNKVFLIHRSTYRVFGENQWREVAARLDMWKSSLTGVLRIIRRERENLRISQEQEKKDADAKGGAFAGDGEKRGGQRGKNYGLQRARETQTLDEDAD